MSTRPRSAGLRLVLGCGLLAALFPGLVGCLELRGPLEVDGSDQGGEGCDDCHGPFDGASAHGVHLSGGDFALLEMGCTDCHAAATNPGSGGHATGTTDVLFADGSLADLGGATPSWDGTRCSGVYCHGATLGGGSLTAPAWSGEIDDGVQCGMCHALPPPSPHTSMTGCTGCHAANYNGDGTLNTAVHVDGVLDLNGKGGAGGEALP